MKRRNREIKRTKIEIIPMIDTMFFLLVFFILVSLGLLNVRGTAVNLPPSETTDKMQKQDNLSATVDIKNGVTYVNAAAIPVTEVGPKLLQTIQSRKLEPANVTVIVRGDTSADYGLVLDCIDNARQSGFERFAVATVKPGEAPQ